MSASTPDRVVMFCTGLAVGLALGIPGGAWLAGEARTHQPSLESAPGPGTAITEDDPRWDCTTMGDQVCGPTNATGAWPGRYEHGNLVEAWPVDDAGDWLKPLTFTWKGTP